MTKNKNSVQGLIGLERFTRFGVKTDKAEIAFSALSRPIFPCFLRRISI